MNLIFISGSYLLFYEVHTLEESVSKMVEKMEESNAEAVRFRNQLEKLGKLTFEFSPACCLPLLTVRM